MAPKFRICHFRALRWKKRRGSLRSRRRCSRCTTCKTCACNQRGGSNAYPLSWGWRLGPPRAWHSCSPRLCCTRVLPSVCTWIVLQPKLLHVPHILEDEVDDGDRPSDSRDSPYSFEDVIGVSCLRTELYIGSPEITLPRIWPLGPGGLLWSSPIRPVSSLTVTQRWGSGQGLSRSVNQICAPCVHVPIDAFIRRRAVQLLQSSSAISIHAVQS